MQALTPVVAPEGQDRAQVDRPLEEMLLIARYRRCGYRRLGGQPLDPVTPAGKLVLRQSARDHLVDHAEHIAEQLAEGLLTDLRRLKVRIVLGGHRLSLLVGS